VRAGARQSSRCTVSQEPASHHETERPIPRAVRRSISCWPRALCGQQLLAVAGTVCTSQHAERVLSFRPRKSSPMHQARTTDAGPELTLTVAIVSAEVWTPAREALPQHWSSTGNRQTSPPHRGGKIPIFRRGTFQGFGSGSERSGDRTRSIYIKIKSKHHARNREKPYPVRLQGLFLPNSNGSNLIHQWIKFDP